MSVVLGVNHQFLYPDAIVNQKVHTDTLKQLAESKNVDAIDCWTWRDNKEEKSILLDSGKIINYNIGDRFGEDIILPSSPFAKDRQRAYDITMREILYALSVNSKKIVLGSGPDMSDDHEGAKERFGEFILKIASSLPEDVELCLEPTDWDVDKHFLFGPLDETVAFIEMIRNNGFKRIGLLLDQCHIGIMHETLESAVLKSKPVLNHVHFGNCVIKDASDPYYGDKHVPWDYPSGEYTTSDAIKFIHLLKAAEYFNREGCTASFEMRPIQGLGSEESLKKWIEVWNMAKEELSV